MVYVQAARLYLMTDTYATITHSDSKQIVEGVLHVKMGMYIPQQWQQLEMIAEALYKAAVTLRPWQ